MSEDLKILIAVLIKNTISLTLWVVLAILFNKWWIALFSILFLTFVENNNKEWLKMITITDLQKQIIGNIILKGLAELEKEKRK